MDHASSAIHGIGTHDLEWICGTVRVDQAYYVVDMCR